VPLAAIAYKVAGEAAGPFGGSSAYPVTGMPLAAVTLVPGPRKIVPPYALTAACDAAGTVPIGTAEPDGTATCPGVITSACLLSRAPCAYPYCRTSTAVSVAEMPVTGAVIGWLKRRYSGGPRMSETYDVYQVRSADNASALQVSTIGYQHTDEGLREALESARERSVSGEEQVVVDLSTDPETVTARYKDGVKI
jgi:hypothetical protein